MDKVKPERRLSITAETVLLLSNNRDLGGLLLLNVVNYILDCADLLGGIFADFNANASSKAITSSTVSRLSASRSSMKEALGVTLDSSTPRCSITIFFTASATLLMTSKLLQRKSFV